MGVFDRKGPDGECADDRPEQKPDKTSGVPQEVSEAELKNQLKQKPKGK